MSRVRIAQVGKTCVAVEGPRGCHAASAWIRVGKRVVVMGHVRAWEAPYEVAEVFRAVTGGKEDFWRVDERISDVQASSLDGDLGGASMEMGA